MAGSPPSRRNSSNHRNSNHRNSKLSKSRRLVISFLATLALVASACSSGDAAEVTGNTARATTTIVVEDADSSTTADGFEQTGEDTAVDTDATDLPTAVVDASISGAQRPFAQLLSDAADNSDAQSYSFAQGMSMQVNIAGQMIDIAPEGAFVFGEVEGDATYIDAQIGSVMAATFESFSIDVSQPPFDDLFGSITASAIEMWSDDELLVIDMTEFANSLGNLDPATAAQLSVFADGPVRINLAEVEGLDAEALANEFGQGAQITDPSDVLEALRAVDAVTEAGTDEVNGIDVQVFDATLSMADYLAALDVDLTGLLGSANVGDIESATVDLVVMVDADELVRRMEIDLALVGPDGSETTLTTWQEFNNYGDPFNIELPDAVDITDQIGGLGLVN